MTLSSDVLVIGGGIHGCATAFHLARKGLAVRLIERDVTGRHASGVNAGSVHHIARLKPELPLAELALAEWPALSALLDADTGYRRTGHLKLAENGEEAEHLRHLLAETTAACAIREDYLDRAAVAALEPNLSRHCRAGIYAPDCGIANPALSVTAFRRAAEAAGATFHDATELLGLSRNGSLWRIETNAGVFHAPRIVNCAGAWGGQVAAMIGEPVTLTPLPLTMTILAPTRPIMSTVIATASRLISIKQFPNGTIAIGGGYRGSLDMETRRAQPEISSLAYNLKVAMSLYPKFSDLSVVRTWAGIEGRSPDGLPIIGPSRLHEGVWHAFAHSTHGFYLGPVTGRLVAEGIVTGERNSALAPLGIERFS